MIYAQLISERSERIIRIAVGLYLGLKALTDLRGSVLALPGIAPEDSSRSLQLSTGIVVLLGVALLSRRRLAKFGAIPLIVVHASRSFWDVAGGEPYSIGWTLSLLGLAIIFWWRPKAPGEAGDDDHREEDTSTFLS
jgi:hypothetical protein